MNPPLSIIFCTYNKRVALKRSLGNVMGQVDLEHGDQVLVADGGSTDGVEKMLRKHFIPYVDFAAVGKHTPWNLNAVRNLGVARAKNDLCVIFDADVIPQPGCIDALRAEAGQGRFRGGSIVYEADANARTQFAKRKDGLVPSVYMVGNYPVEEIIKMLEEGRTDKTGSMGGIMCFSKTDWQRVGGFDEAYDGYWGFDDTDFLLKLHFSDVDVNVIKPKMGPRGWEGALGFHQVHSERRGWKLESMQRNRRILVSRLPAYKAGRINEAALGK
jgi:glycosyltransferase involved in cell wall biosynthesis